MSLKLKRHYPLIVILISLVLLLTFVFGSLPVGAYTVNANPAAAMPAALTTDQSTAALNAVNEVLHSLQVIFAAHQ